MKNMAFAGCFVGMVVWALAGFGYTQLGPDRVLLMNNDTNAFCSVSCQGYFDTNVAQNTYWVHSSESPGRSLFWVGVQRGRSHTLYRHDGTPLWNLADCCAGSCTLDSELRNYIPWSPSAESITVADEYDISPTNATAMRGVGSVIMCNSTNACVYSPYYEDGVGAIHFDAVNSYTNWPGTIGLEIATNAIGGASLASTNYDQFAWFPCPADVLTVRKWVGIRRVVRVVEEGATDIALDATEGLDNKFFRIRANVHSFLDGYRGPIRFRIVRKDGAYFDNSYFSNILSRFLLVDNIVASYPPVTATVYPQSLLESGGSNVYASAACVFRTNAVAGVEGETASDWLEAMFICRRQRPDLTFGDWQTNAMEFADGTLRTREPVLLPGESEGMEYYVAASLSAPCYVPVDFVLGTTTRTSFGSGWTEAVAHVESSSLCRLAAKNGTVWQYEVRNDEAILGECSSGFSVAPPISSATIGSLTIPPALGGYPVTGIGDYTFFGCTNLTSVTIPDSVTWIGWVAFQLGGGFTRVIFKGDKPYMDDLALVNSGATNSCAVYVRRGSTGWGRVPRTWNAMALKYWTLAVANELGEGTVVEGELSEAEVASGVTVVVKGGNADAAALAARITPKPHEEGQDAGLFKVRAEAVAGGVSLSVVLDEESVDPDATAAEIVGAGNLAAFGAAADGESVYVRLPSAKPGLYYGIAAASDLAGLDSAAVRAPLTKAGEGGVTVPVAKPAGGAAFFKIIVSDRSR